MRRFTCFHFLVLLILVLPVFTGRVSSQVLRNDDAIVKILGWKDDTHYLIRTYNKDLQTEIKCVDIETGEGVLFTPDRPAYESLVASLPEGYDLGDRRVISHDMKSLIFEKENDLFIFKEGYEKVRRLTRDKQTEVNVRFSNDGRRVAYTKNKDLYVYDLENDKEIRLTFDASEKIYNGFSSWVYMEEILGRASHYAAFWWSPDGNRLAYLRTDETDVPVFTLNRLDEADGIHGIIEATPYPKPGDPNPRVKMGIADIRTGKTIWVKTDNNEDQYIAWPFWTPDSRKLAIQVVNRDQNNIKFLLADPSRGDFSVIYQESRETWVDFFEDIYVMNNGSGFIVRSSRTGWENLFYYGWNGKLITQLTNFNFRVLSIDRVDEVLNKVYFSATGPESTDVHAFSVTLDGKDPVQITKGRGSHSVSISPQGTYFIDTWSSVSSPGSIIAFDKEGSLLGDIYNFQMAESGNEERLRSEMVFIRTNDSLFDMPAIITFPVNFNPSEQYPVVFTIYGGPDSRNVYNRWRGNTPSWYSKNGIITFTVDHRGSGQFGRRGLDYLYRSLGKWEILDYIDAVKWLREKPYVDSTRMGITGSSYGGYLTCLALTKGAGYWTHGFAGSPVTDFRLYDNIYTERFMDTPGENPGGYTDGSSLTFVENYRGKLYITHGDMDDNVHMQNSIYLISRLEDEGKSFSFMLYPGSRHGLSGKKYMHSQGEAHKFWLANFFGRYY